MEGKLLIFSAPSGSGKTTIVQHLLKMEWGLAFSISATSREPRSNEQEGREYYFMSPETFREKIDQQAFIEWEEVYPGQFYGTLKIEVERIWERGEHALFDIDVMGGLNLKKQYGERACAIFVKPPSLEVLEERLRLRKTENERSIRKRLAKAGHELQYASQFDHILVNDHLESTLNKAEILVRKFLAI
jgi:guanylate kinase